MKVDRYGDRAVRITVADVREAHHVAASLREIPELDVLDVVPAWRSVIAVFRHDADPLAVRARLPGTSRLSVTAPADQGLATPRRHRIAVRYDGDDLLRVAGRAGIDVDDVIARHAKPEYVVGFLGFLPGFGYLSGLDPALATPRHDTPRRSVRAGAVGIAGDVTGIYPRSSPGGWNIVGHTETVLFDADLGEPSLLRPGDIVRFEAV